MPCLDKRFRELQALLGESAKIVRGSMAHIRRIYCPVLALQGVVKIHPNNGVYVGISDGVVYAKCADCSCDGVDGKHSLVELVEGAEQSKSPWVKYTSASYSNLTAVWRRKGPTPFVGDKHPMQGTCTELRQQPPAALQ